MPTAALKPPVLFSRQRQLLQLVDALGGAVSRTDLQKLLFLYCQEQPVEARAYDFVPYKFGAFSFTSYADGNKLRERGLLRPDAHEFTITPTGRAAIVDRPDATIARFAANYAQLRGDPLVAFTYRRYPYYATRSEIAERVLEDDPIALAAIVAARPAATKVSLSTIGYEGHSLESYLNTLLRAGITLLCDVRRNPLSRKYGFSKSTLSRGCEGVGIRYEHVPQLGIASEQRQGLNTQADYDALFEDYERDWLPKQSGALLRLKAWIDEGHRIALTCYERHPHQCHRHCVAEALEKKSKGQFTAQHL